MRKLFNSGFCYLLYLLCLLLCIRVRACVSVLCMHVDLFSEANALLQSMKFELSRSYSQQLSPAHLKESALLSPLSLTHLSLSVI